MREYLSVLSASLLVFVLSDISYGKNHAARESKSGAGEKTATVQAPSADDDDDKLDADDAVAESMRNSDDADTDAGNDASEGQLKRIIAKCKRQKMLDDDQAAYLLSGAGRHEYKFANTGCSVVVNTTEGISFNKVSDTLNHAVNTLGYMAQSPAGSFAGQCFQSLFKDQKTLYIVILPRTAGFAGAYIGKNSILLSHKYTGPDKRTVPHEIAHVIYGHGITRETKQKVIADQEAMGYSAYRFEFFPMITTDYIWRSDRSLSKLKTTCGTKFGKEYTKDLVDMLVALYGKKKLNAVIGKR